MLSLAPKKFLGYVANIVAIAVIAFAVRYYLSTPTISNELQQATNALFAASFPDARGKSQAIAQWKGKILIVNFWATWCPPCLEEMPELSRLQDKYRGSNVMVIGIATDEVDKIHEFAKTLPVSYPLLSGNIQAMDLGMTLGNDKGVLPYTVIIKPDGSIAKAHFGQVDQALIEQTILPLIKP
jgi:thiol-disulfide isomerase/thioredoxin